MNNTVTQQIQSADAAHHMHPFTHGNELAKRGSRVIEQARGVWLRDSEGHEIIDGMAGLWCVNIGYGRDEIAKVAAEQIKQLSYYNTFFQTTHPNAARLAAKIAQLSPPRLDHVFFASSGSEANDTNIRMVRHYFAELGQPQRNVIIGRKNGYHGSTVGAASLGGMSAMHAQGGLPIADIHHINQPNWWLEGGEMTPAEFALARARELEQAIIEIGEHRVAAFIAEPIQGAGGCIIPPPNYWSEIQRICKQYNILLIADEVICGFGRVGQWFASQAMDISADIITVAKGLSSGYAPIGASVVSSEIAAVINESEFNHGYTYSGHPLTTAIALENLRIMEDENILGWVREVAAPHLQRCWRALTDHPLVGEATIYGMMGSIALSPDKDRRASFGDKAGAVGVMCRERCFANSVVIRHVSERMIVCPPLIITPDEIDIMMERLRLSLDETYAELLRTGLMTRR